jgi:WD40 repeat protein
MLSRSVSGAGVEEQLQPGDPERIGPFRVISRLGSGGMGRVFLCRSAGGRPVAVKVIRADLAADGEFRARFRREIEAARKVSGLYTVLLVDADLDGPVPWLATSYVPGPSLADAVSAHGPFPPASVLMLAAGLAESLAAIHAAGVVHRDLKPSNVLLADDGPRVIDFGISRAAEASVLTSTGVIVGSPGFMSPEQAEGGLVGPPSDLFSLGAVVIFAATGHSPFGTGSTPALLYRIVHGVPDLGAVPADIRALAGRCLAKDPGMRPTPADLLAELGDAGFTAGWLPVPVRTEITRQAGSGSQTYLGTDPAPGRPEPVPATRAGPAAIRSQEPGWAATLTRAPDPDRGQDRPSRHPALIATIADPGDRAVYAVAFSPEGDVLAAANDSGQIHLWNVASGQRAATLADRSSQGVMSVAFAPGGELLAAADGNGRIYLWDLISGELARTFTRRRSHAMTSVAFGLDGDVLAAANSNGRVYMWDIPSAKIAATFADPGSQGVMSVAFGPDGELLAAADRNGRIYLWNIISGELTATFTSPGSQGMRDAAFAPEGDILAAADASGRVCLWNTARAGPARTLGTPGSAAACAVTFRPEGRVLASGHADGRICLWDTASGDLTKTFEYQSSQGLNSLGFRPDGDILAVGDGNGNTYLWNTAAQAR